MQQLISKISNFISFDSIPVMGLADYVEILIIAFLVYEVMLWIKDTRAWSLMRGIVIILVFVLLAYLFQMTTILWLVRNGLNVLLMALLIIFQPELRRGPDCPDDFRSHEPDSRAGADQAQRPERMQGSLHSHPQ